MRRRFWRKLKRVAVQLPFAEDLLAAYYCAFDRQTPRHVQASLLGAIAYFILPFDFVPDVMPILGFTDDAAVLATAIRMVASHITTEHREAARAVLKRGVDECGGGAVGVLASVVATPTAVIPRDPATPRLRRGCGPGQPKL